MSKKIARLALYLLGLFMLAVGIALSIKSNLGVSPVTSIPYTLSQVTGRTIGTITLVYYIICVGLQILILGKDYKLKNLLQIGFSTVFGLFTDFAMLLFINAEANTYFTQVLFLVISVLIVSLGLFLVISADIVVNAPEGLCLAISEKYDYEFSKVKSYFDIASVLIAILISALAFRELGNIREGTIVAALAIGKLLGYIMKIHGKRLHLFLHEDQAKLDL